MRTIQPILPKGATATMPERFICPICGKEPTCKGFNNHLNRCLEKHNMTRDQYEKVHQETLYSPAHQFAVKWFKLANFSIYHFGLMDYAGLDWCHLTAAAPRPWYYSSFGRQPETCPLLRFEDGTADLRRSFWHFKKHLRGDLTLGIWPAMTNRFTMIDLDNEDVAYRDELADRLVDLQLFFYLVFSGKKGYQFWIFWDEDLLHAELLQLQSFICVGIQHDKNVWPYKKSLIKLPLGLHRGTQHLACFVNADGEPFELDKQFIYSLQMKDNHVPRAFYSWRERLVFPVVDQKKNKTIHVNEVQSESASSPPERSREPLALERCLNKGTKLQEGRHLTLFLPALHLKENKNVALEEAQETLDSWSSQVDSKHGLKERLRDAHSTVRRVYERDMVFSAVAMSALTEEERVVIEEVCEVCISVYGALGSKRRKEDLTKRTKSAQKVALLMAAMYKSQDGSFSVGERKLGPLAEMST